MASTTTMPISRINIIGAGVLGLSTALTLQDRHPSLPITIIASEFPSLPSSWTRTPSTSTSPPPSPQSQTNNENKTAAATTTITTTPSADYASMWAGAHYRPIPRSTRQLDEEYRLAILTSQKMRSIALSHDENETGVRIMPAVELLESVPGEVEDAIAELADGSVYAGEGDGFRVLKEEELKGYSIGGGDVREGGIKWGCSYESWCVNVHVYCVWLLKKFIGNGGQIVHRELGGVGDAFGIPAYSHSAVDYSPVPLVVNCSGRNFDTDPKTQIIRGQTVLVRNEYHRTITRQNADGNWAFLIPRPGGGGTVVGGTKEIGDLEEGARLESREKLLRSAVKYFPDFVESVEGFEVVMDNVGRRPWREGGLRIEAEEVGVAGGGNGWVVHGYGAGGRGYELSWGVAEQIADLVDARL